MSAAFQAKGRGAIPPGAVSAKVKQVNFKRKAFVHARLPPFPSPCKSDADTKSSIETGGIPSIIQQDIQYDRPEGQLRKGVPDQLLVVSATLLPAGKRSQFCPGMAIAFSHEDIVQEDCVLANPANQ